MCMNIIRATSNGSSTSVLSGHEGVDLEPEDSKTVEFAVPLGVLAYTGLAGDVVMEPGPIELSAGSSSDDLRSTATVAGEARVMNGDERAFFSTASISS